MPMALLCPVLGVSMVRGCPICGHVVSILKLERSREECGFSKNYIQFFIQVFFFFFLLSVAFCCTS